MPRHRHRSRHHRVNRHWYERHMPVERGSSNKSDELHIPREVVVTLCIIVALYFGAWRWVLSLIMGVLSKIWAAYEPEIVFILIILVIIGIISARLWNNRISQWASRHWLFFMFLARFAGPFAITTDEAAIIESGAF
jgi:hypothetical protein